jgi:hypothetical protein
LAGWLLARQLGRIIVRSTRGRSMIVNKRRVSLGRFIEVGELLDEAFPDPMPAPDYLAHQCELAEHALMGLSARLASTRDPKLAQLFSVPHEEPEHNCQE